jgi:glycosyltransferase involved in cell wall biosynthesis
LSKKWSALDDVFAYRVLNAGSGGGDPRFKMLPESAPSFYGRLPLEIAKAIRAFRPDAVICSDPYIGAAALLGRRLSGRQTKVVVEVHGQPRTFTRSYGSRARRVLSPVADRVMRWSLRNADATRGLSRFTSDIIEELRGVPATATFPTYSDLSAFSDSPIAPVPGEKRVVFVGALEPYKNPDVLAAAWRQVARSVPDAALVVVGDGSRREAIDALRRELPNQVEHHLKLTPREVAEQIDRARALVLPSWPEGLGRVVLEAFARGRCVVATDAGGIPEIATNDLNAILLPPADEQALVTALKRVLADHELARRLGSHARAAYLPWHQTPEDFARSYRSLVDDVIAGAR